MKVLILANADIGLYKFRKELLQVLCSENDVTAAIPYGEFAPSIEELGCKVVDFPVDRRGTDPLEDYLLYRRYRKLIAELKPDAVLTYTIKPNIYGGMASRRAGVPFIANVTGLGTAVENGGLLAALTKRLYRTGLRGASCVFFQNRENKRLFEEQGIVKGRSRLIPGSGVNLSVFTPLPYPSEETGIRFLFVGRVMRDKGINELLYAVRALHREEPSVSLDIVGWCEEDEPEALREAQAEGAVRFHGKQANVLPYYNDCSCAVLPSYHEGLANVMLEASACARPVITTFVPGCRETFEEGITGFGCEKADEVGLLDAMRRFAALPREERAAMGIAARKKIEREFDRKAVIEAYLQELSSCVDRKKG